MKAKTQAAKRRAKRGRPRVENAIREPNGRVSRSDDPPALLALSRRAKHLNLTLDQAQDQKAGSFIGYLSMLGPRDGLSTSQYEAIMRYKEIRHSALKAMQAPDGTLDNGVSGRAGDEVSEEYVRWCRNAKERYEEARSAIRSAQEINRRENLWAAVDHIIIREQEFHHMIGATRIIGNALARHFGV